jgi:cytoskeletal protein CcmA (bactofilin family)
MKTLKNSKFKSLIIVGILIALIFSVFANVCYAENEDNGENEIAVISSNDETLPADSSDTTTKVEKDVFLCDNSVTIDYPVSGNVYIMGKDVTINSVVDGNIFVLAGNLEIGEQAYIYSDLFVCANDVTIKGYVYDVYSISSNLKIEDSAYIIRDISAGANTVSLNGLIRRNANLSFDSITIDETNAKIGGDLSYSSKSASIPESIVSGNVNYSEAKDDEEVISPASIVKDYFYDALKVLVLGLVIVLIVIFAMPKFAEKEEVILKNKLWQTLGYGALAFIAVPVACFILLFTIIGILPAFAIIFVYAFLISIAPAIVSIPVGKMLCDKMKKDSKGMRILMSMVSILVIWLVKQLPIIGGVAGLAVILFGLGIIVYSIFSSTEKIKKNDVVAEATVVVEPKKEENKESDKKADKKENDKEDK